MGHSGPRGCWRCELRSSCYRWQRASAGATGGLGARAACDRALTRGTVAQATMITDLCFFAINKSLGIHCESPARSVGSVRCCASGARPSPGLLLGRKIKESAHACSTHSGGVRCATCNSGNGEAGRALVTVVGYVFRDFAVISPWPACLLAWTASAALAPGQGASPWEMSRPCPACPPSARLRWAAQAGVQAADGSGWARVGAGRLCVL
jgi:hypothetical protein